MSGIRASHPSGRCFAAFGFAILQIRRTLRWAYALFILEFYKWMAKAIRL